MKKTSIFCVAICLSPFLNGCGVEQEKPHGKWIVEDGPTSTPKGMIVDMGSDGKLAFELVVNGSSVRKEAGTWSVSADRLTFNADGKEGKARIRELTKDKLVLKADDQPKEAVLKRVK